MTQETYIAVLVSDIILGVVSFYAGMVYGRHKELRKRLKPKLPVFVSPKRIKTEFAVSPLEDLRTEILYAVDENGKDLWDKFDGPKIKDAINDEYTWWLHDDFHAGYEKDPNDIKDINI